MIGRLPENSAPESKPPPSVGRVLGLTMVAIFSTTLFMRAVDPLVPQIADYFIVDPHTVALLAAAFSLPYAITQPILGGLADAFGKAQLMIWSLVILVISAAIGAAAPNLTVPVGSRGL